MQSPAACFNMQSQCHDHLGMQQVWRVNTIGLCHGVQGGHQQIAEVLGLEQDEVDIICAGINHQTWYIQVKHKERT